MVNAGVEIVVMEVSAHASYYKKIYGIDFEVLAFTNLTQDHLDFFENINKYEQAKLDIFINNKAKFIVANIDDETGKKISKTHKNSITYGLKNPSDVFAINLKQTINGTNFIINFMLGDC